MRQLDQLEAALHRVLSNTFMMYFKAHSYHWNITGRNFAQDHAFFGDLYSELHSSVDDIAEQLRSIGVYAPRNIAELYQNKTILEDEELPESFEAMIESLLVANTETITSLSRLFSEASAINNQGLADFAAGLLDKHVKRAWMLKSHLG